MWKLKVEPDDYILIVSPHPDDESIGCGGLILTYGAQIEILLITDGRTAHGEDLTDEECAVRRYLEFQKMLDNTTVRKHYNMKIADGNAITCAKALENIDITKYTKVFVPNRAEEHIDHRAVNECVRKLMRKKRCKAALYEYEVWSPLAYPTHYIDISSCIESKEELISCYKSQLCIRDYLAMVRGINAYRGVSCHTKYAEAYELISSKNLQKKMLFAIPIRFQKMLLKIIERFDI